MAPSKFEIIYDKKDKVFYAGDKVTGKVILSTPEDIRCKGVFIRFIGIATVYWKETQHRGKHRKTLHLRNKEEYFSETTCLYNPGGKESLRSGDYEWSFAHHLNSKLPSSYEGRHGKVRFSATCTIDRPMRTDNVVASAFTVNSHYDLNTDSRSLQSQVQSDGEAAGGLCCASGGVTAQFSLERTGYVPGEKINLSGLIKNDSGKNLAGSTVKLIQKVAFKSETKSKSYTRTLVAIRREKPISSASKDTWDGSHMNVPPVPPTDLIGCNIINIQYTLQLEVLTTGLSFNLEIPLDLVIGTKPHKKVLILYQKIDMGPTKVKGSAPSEEVLYDGNTDNEVAPPTPKFTTFQEIEPNPPPEDEDDELQVDTQDRDLEDVTAELEGEKLAFKEFAPRYPYYNWTKYVKLVSRVVAFTKKV